MEQRQVFYTALMAGEIMLRSGAEVNRVEDTVNRILGMGEVDTAESYVTTTGIVMTMAGGIKWPLTAVKRVNHRQIDLGKIEKVNGISRDLAEGKLSFGEAYAQLRYVKYMQVYGEWLHIICYVLASVFFTLSIDWGNHSFLVAGMNGAAVSFVNYLGRKVDVSVVIKNIAAALVVSCLTVITGKAGWFDMHMDSVIIGSIIPLMPGVAITSAVRDTLNGDFMSGLARFMEALMIAASLAIGIGLGFVLLLN